MPREMRGGVLFAYLDNDSPKTITYIGQKNKGDKGKDQKKKRGKDEVLGEIKLDSTQKMETFCEHYIEHYEHDHDTDDDSADVGQDQSGSPK